MSAEESKAVLRRWYDEMWSQRNADLILELVGPTYTRHESGSTRVVTAREYRDQTHGLMQSVKISDMQYALLAEGDMVVAIGSWKFNGQEWGWVQAFRVAEGRLVETWLSGIATESGWIGSGAYENLGAMRAPG